MFRKFLFIAALGGLSLGAAQASDPPSHDVTVPTTVGQVVTVSWTGTSPPGASGAATNSCVVGDTSVEDHHLVNLTVPNGAYDTVSVSANFTVAWTDGGQDLVLTVNYEGAEAASSDGGTPSETVVLSNPAAGEFDAVVCAFAATAPTDYTGTLTLTATALGGGSDASPEAGTGDAAGLAPRFQIYAPDYPNQGFGMFGGEATLDINVNTGSIFYIGFLETLRLQLDESTSPAIETWENKSGTLNSLTTSDPILVADRDTGRVFAQQLIVGEGNSLSEFSDDDGETWTPGGGGGIRSGADHQSLGVGPYPADSLIPHPAYPNAVYYCSQDIALVFCSRSDDGGLTFGAGVPIYTLADCQGLHGHVKIAPNGVVYVPIAGCPSPLVDSTNSLPAVAVSEDAGVTWEIRPITTAELGSGGHGSDPSVGIADDNTVYITYMDARNGEPHMARSLDNGVTWERDVNLGQLAGITAAEFPAVVAGDGDRAAVAFFGTTFTGDGDPNGEAFPGSWHLYNASTFDGGQSYHVVNVTPGDPIQRGGLCSGGFCRNLLDFFDSVIDTEGRLLISYEDGCIGGCPNGSHPTFSDQAVIARQEGGPRMFAAFDPVEPVAPRPPRLTGYRNQVFALLEWPAPDNGGSEISNYTLLRGTSADNLSAIANTGKQRSFVDTGLDAGTTYHYAVQATNGRGSSARGNVLALAEGDGALDQQAGCALPGIQMAIDRTLEPEAQPPQRDLTGVLVAEPEELPGTIAFTLTNLAPQPPDQSNHRFYVTFDVAPAGERFQLFMQGTTATVSRRVPDEASGNWNALELVGDLNEASSFNTDGSLTMVADTALLGIDQGDTLLQVYAYTLTGGAGSNILTEEAGYFDYTLVGNDFCSRGGLPIPPVAVTPNPPGGSGGDVDGRFGGGALGLPVLLMLLVLGLRRRSFR